MSKSKKKMSKRMESLAREMYPKELDQNPTYAWTPKHTSQPPALGRLVEEITGALDGLADEQMDGLGDIVHGAKVLILALQNELKIAQEVIVSLKDDVPRLRHLESGNRLVGILHSDTELLGIVARSQSPQLQFSA